MKSGSMVRTSLLLLLGTFAFGSRLSGQAVVTGPTWSVLTSIRGGPLRSSVLQQARDSVERDIRPTYWKEGALVGGLVGLGGGAVLGLVICAQSDEVGDSCTGSAVAGGLISALVLAIPGALIGGQIHKAGATE